MKNIVLIGMPGCGKSTLGRCLAERLGRDFIDADPEIEKDAGKTIPELFAISEDCFRRQETLTTKRLATLQNKVLAMGGGVVLRQENISSLKENGLVIFLIVLRKISSVTWIQKQDPCWQQGGNESMICMRSGKHCTVRQQT